MEVGGCGVFFHLSCGAAEFLQRNLPFLTVVSSVLPVEDRFPLDSIMNWTSHFSPSICRASHVTPQPEDSWIPLLINAVDHCMNRIKELTQNELELWVFRLICILLSSFLTVTGRLWCLLWKWGYNVSESKGSCCLYLESDTVSKVCWLGSTGKINT